MPRHERNDDVESGARPNNNDDSFDPYKRNHADHELHRRALPDYAEEAPSSSFANQEEESRAEGSDDKWGGSELQGAFTPRGPRGYRRSDSSIREDIAECLSRDGQIDAGGIQVTVEDGEVTLTGTTLTREETRLAEIIAEQCAGVKVVCNELRVYQKDSDQADSCQADNQCGQDPHEGEWDQLRDAPLSAARAN